MVSRTGLSRKLLVLGDEREWYGGTPVASSCVFERQIGPQQNKRKYAVPVPNVLLCLQAQDGDAEVGKAQSGRRRRKGPNDDELSNERERSALTASEQDEEQQVSGKHILRLLIPLMCCKLSEVE